ncbi:MAG: hypothetical protein APR53_00075 [Methanoculleus sp. SDB]|nr:MAG: hypothetical protein APR53_00075 [Methanoculleus sp. SDB]
MNTGGYDVVMELHEDLINTFLKVAYCLGKFPVFEGVYTLPVPDVPPDLEDFMEIGYRVSLAREPSFEVTDAGELQITVRGETIFTVLGAITFDLEAQFRIAAIPRFDPATRQFRVECTMAAIEDVELDNRYHLPASVLEKLNQILAIGMEAFLTEEVTTIELSPVIFSADLPFMPAGEAYKLPISLGATRVFPPSVTSGAVNLLGYTGGSAASVTDFTRGNHIGIGVNEAAMHRVYDFWWANTTHPKTVTVMGSYDYDPPDFVDFIDSLLDWGTAVLTLGLVDTDVDLDRIWIDAGAAIGFSKFTFDLLPGNTVRLSGSVTLDIWAEVYMQITTTTELFWGLWEVDQTTSTVKLFDLEANGITVVIDNAEGVVTLDPSRRLMVDLTALDIDIPLSWDVPEFILDYIVDWAINSIVTEMPPIVLFPAMIEQTLPGTSVSVSVAGETLEINETEALVSLNISTSGADTYAPYIANENTGEVHVRECEWAHRIALRNRVYYCTLEDAIADGYNGCAFCLPRYDTG